MLRSILQNSSAGFYVFASDSTSPTSGKTGLTITTTLSKAGGTANSVSPTITEIGNGLYWIAPSTSHRDTLGEIAWQFSGSGAIIAPRLEKVVLVNDQTARFGASDGTGVTISGTLTTLDAIWNKIKAWLGAIAGMTTDTVTRAEINATTAGATFNETTDSLEAQANATTSGDWTSNERTAIRTILGIPSSGTTPDSPTDGALYDIAATLSGTAIEPTSRVASGGTITAYMGDDFRVRSDTELSVSTSDVGGTLYTKWTAIGEENLYFGASREGSEIGAISGTIAQITQSGSGASQIVTLKIEIQNCGSGLKAGTYEYQIEQRQAQSSEEDSFIELSGTLILKRNVVA